MIFLRQVPNLNFFFRKNYRTSLTERKHRVFQIFVFQYPGKLFCTFALRDEVRSFGKHPYAIAIWVPVCCFWYPTREFQRFVSSTYRQFRLYYFYSPIYTSRVACVLQGSVCSRVVALIGIDKDDENGTSGFGSIGDGNSSSVRDEAVWPINWMANTWHLRTCCLQTVPSDLFYTQSYRVPKSNSTLPGTRDIHIDVVVIL